MLVRITVSFILLLSMLFMPFWLFVVLAFGAMIYFSFFWEGVILFLLSDLLYGVKENRFYGIYFISFLFSTLILIIIEIVRKKIRFSKLK